MSDFWVDLARDLRLDLLGFLATAIVLGAAVGLERELRGKAAGLRTNVLICVGSTLFTWLSIEIAGPYGDPGRIAAQIVTGVGFIGAGTILHARGHISGLTSAATIWLVAAIGVAVGAGAVLEATGATFFVLVVLGLLRPLERYLTSYGGIVRVTVEVEPRPEAVTDIERIVRGAGLEVAEIRSEQRGDRMVVHVAMSGPARLHDQAKLELLRTSGALTISVEE
jgi:putative Mg2+ transporter-C (MgtC) family protein